MTLLVAVTIILASCTSRVQFYKTYQNAKDTARPQDTTMRSWVKIISERDDTVQVVVEEYTDDFKFLTAIDTILFPNETLYDTLNKRMYYTSVIKNDDTLYVSLGRTFPSDWVTEIKVD